MPTRSWQGAPRWQPPPEAASGNGPLLAIDAAVLRFETSLGARRASRAAVASRTAAIARRGVRACLLVAALAWSCTSSDKSTGPGTGGNRIVVAPESTTVTIGDSTTLTARMQNPAGQPVSGVAYFWASSDSTIASVSQSGSVTARSAGRAQIAASAQGVSGVGIVVVSPKAASAITIVPAAATLRVNTTLQLSDTVRDADGQPVTGQAVTWTSDNGTVATVDAAGLVVARNVGTVHITATDGNAAGSATITVTLAAVAALALTPHNPKISVGQTEQLTATPTDSAGNPLLGRAITWQSSAPTVATVSLAGLVSGVSPGKTLVRATSESVSNTDTVTVAAAPVSSVVLSPSTSSLFVKQTEKITAEVTDANGVPIAHAAVTYSTSNAAVASVDATTGLVTGVGPGIASITGTSGGKTGQAAVAVFQVPVASVTVTPQADTLTVGQKATLKAAAFDSAGHPITGQATTWSSNTPAVATVDHNGAVQAVGAGTAIITAAIGGKLGTAVVTVQEVPVGSVVVTPNTASLQTGQQRQFTAVVRDRNGAVVTDRAVTWTSTAKAVATVGSSGLVLAVAPGTATISAQAEKVTGAARVTVIPIPVASVTVVPTLDTIYASAPGNTVAMSDTTKSASGAVLTGRSVQWSSNQPVATVSPAGVVTGANAGSGTALITATSADGPSGSATVVVIGHVATVAVVPNVVTLSTAGIVRPDSATLSATLTDSFGADVTGQRTVTWTSSDPTIATVGSSSGFVVAVASTGGTVQITATTPDGATGIATVLVLP